MLLGTRRTSGALGHGLPHAHLPHGAGGQGGHRELLRSPSVLALRALRAFKADFAAWILKKWAAVGAKQCKGGKRVEDTAAELLRPRDCLSRIVASSWVRGVNAGTGGDNACGLMEARINDLLLWTLLAYRKAVQEAPSASSESEIGKQVMNTYSVVDDGCVMLRHLRAEYIGDRMMTVYIDLRL